MLVAAQAWLVVTAAALLMLVAVMSFQRAADLLAAARHRAGRRTTAPGRVAMGRPSAH